MAGRQIAIRLAVSAIAAALIEIIVGVLALAAAAAYFVDFRGTVTNEWKTQLEWRRRLADRFRWLPDPPKFEQLRSRIAISRVLGALFLLLLGAIFLVVGLHSALQ